MLDKKNSARLILYWLEASEKDMESANQIYEKTVRYVSVLYHIHLSIEKIIKALYVKNNKDHAPYSHNLLYLSKSAGLELTDKDIKLLSEINEFNIECRYPDEKFSIYKKAGKNLTGKYLKKAWKFREWILKKLEI